MQDGHHFLHQLIRMNPVLKQWAVLASTLVVFALAEAAETQPPSWPKADPAAIANWQAKRFGMFIHFGPVSLSGQEIGWSRGDQTPIEVYDNLYTKFNPTNFNADTWVNVAKAAGMKYIVLTTKHHDGFALWDTKFSDYNIMKTPFHRDLVAELAAACKKQGMPFGTYYSTCDWWHRDFPLTSPGGSVKRETSNLDAYNDYLLNQIRELVTNYGPLLTIWNDVPQMFEGRGAKTIQMIRALQPALAEDLHQTVVIENRTGAGGNIGIAAVVQAAADGYTLGVAAAGVLTVNPHLNRAAMTFDPLKDLVPITLLAEIPFVLVASQQSRFSSVDDVIAAARARPGELSIGHGGNGTAMHLTSALFNQKAGVSIQLIAYRGSAPAAVDVLAGHIPLAVLDVPVSQQLIRDGKLKALGVSAAGRISFLPDVPPLSELGLKDFDSVGWFGLVAPAGTPPEIIARLNAAFVKALNDPAAAAKIRVLGAEPTPSSPEDFAKFIRSENAKWGKLITDAGIKGE